MKATKYDELLGRLDIMLNVGGDKPSVSPALGPSGAAYNRTSGIPFITRNMNVNDLTDNETSLVHVLLHQFYASGNKELTRVDIEQLHNKVRKKLKDQHIDFDKLDWK